MRSFLFGFFTLMFLAGCGLPPEDSSPAGPDLTLQVAQTRAVELGRQVTPEISEVQAQLNAGNEMPEALTHVFGPEVSKEVLADGQVMFGNAFSIGAADMEGNPGSVPSVDGRPSILIWSLTGDNGFFYEPTVWDMRTGSLYQGIALENISDASAWRFFGPWSPPLNARVTGVFDDTERWELYNSIRSGLFGNEES